MSKKSSYKKLKEENERLKKDIYTLVMKPDSIDALSLKMQYAHKFEIDNLMFAGSHEVEVNLTGIFKSISYEG